MNADIRIDTPLGPVDVGVGVTAAGGGPVGTAGGARVELPGGARELTWADVDGLTVDALVTTPTPYVHPTGGADFPDTLWCAVDLQLHARAEVAGVRVAARFADDTVLGYWSSGERLVAVEFADDDWELAIGGPDEEALLARAEAAGEPAAWSSTVHGWGDFVTGVSPDGRRRLHGLAWDLPALAPGETARTHVAVAWCRTGHPVSGTAPWFAVDVRSADIRTAAGLTP